MIFFAVGIVGVIILSSPVIAQEIQNFPRLDENIERNLDQNLDFETIDKLAPPPLEPQPRVSLPASAVQVVEFRIKGNTAISDSDLQVALDPYLGNKITNEDLVKIEKTLSDYYADQGFLEVGVFISEIE